jgi:endonuclease/exonuclease/phosphatase family metal-dependent hydrolase
MAPSRRLAIAPRRRLAAALAAAIAALLLLSAGPLPTADAAPPAHANDQRTVSVLSRNLYLGASLSPLFGPSAATPQGLLAAASGMWDQVRRTDYPTRAKGLADEIATLRPALVGLQEVTLYRVGAFGDPARATTVRMDFLAILQAELRARGQRYDVVVSQEAFDGELSAFDWPTAAGGTGGLIDVRLTDRDVILVRRGPETANMSVSNAQGGLFAAALELPIPALGPGARLRIDRGWTSVDVQHRGREFRFINTHLEAFEQQIAAAQTEELLTRGPAATRMPVVLTGDFNSAPGQAAYGRIADAGFRDVAVGGAPTCCYDDDLADPAATLRTRIDLVFVRGPLRFANVARVGVDPFRTTAPLWASDHAGIRADILLD